MPEREWFEIQQPLMVWLANHVEGRQLLQLHDNCTRHKRCRLGRIDAIGHNFVSQHNYVLRNGNVEIEKTTVFRVGTPYGNEIRMKWLWFQELAREYYRQMELQKLMHVGMYAPVTRYATREWGTTTDFNPDPDPETTTVDGAVSSSSSSSWPDDHNAGTGTAVADSNTSTWCEVNFATVWGISRGFVLFDTSSIGSDTVSAADLWLQERISNNGRSADDDNTYCVQSSPASNTSLSTADFDACGSINSPTTSGDGYSVTTAISTSISQYFFNAGALAWVDTGGVTKLGLRHGDDFTTTTPTDATNPSYHGLNWYTAEVGAGNDPELTVTHAASGPAASRRLVTIA